MNAPSDLPPQPHDVRMRGFSHRATVAQTLDWLASQLRPLPSELVGLHEAAGRVLSSDITSPTDVPTFRRAMMDGYAVQANDTDGASSYNRLTLSVIGLSLPGKPSSEVVTTGSAVKIMTGAPLPEGADAVIPVEKTEQNDTSIAILDSVPPGKHIGQPGEDIQAGSRILSAGRRLRAQDVGILSSVGFAELEVVSAPRVRIVVTGDELLPPGSPARENLIVDSNSPMLAALIRRDGGIPLNPGIVPDDREQILRALRDEADVILVSGGSSVGQEDHAPTLLAEHGELAIHGVAMRPSSPVGMGTLDGRLVFLLPGNPVSCLCAYDFFAGRAIRGLAGRPLDWPHRSVKLPLKRKLVSAVGRVDYARVTLLENSVEPLAISGASVLSSTTRADGFVLIPEDSEGFAAGSEVTVLLYDSD